MKFKESLKLLAAEIGNPRYGSYHIYLTNLLPKASVKQLAEADMQEVVKEIKEIYIDYLPIGKSILSSFLFPGLPPFHVPKSVAGTHLFGLSLQHPLQPLGSRSVLPLIVKTTQTSHHRWVEESLQRTSQALASLLLSLRLSPTIRLLD